MPKDPHERIAPGTAPGTLVARVIDLGGAILAEHVLDLGNVEDHATADAETPGVGAVYLYDGDTGECVATLSPWWAEPG
jgi:hypothetical protein